MDGASKFVVTEEIVGTAMYVQLILGVEIKENAQLLVLTFGVTFKVKGILFE